MSGRPRLIDLFTRRGAPIVLLWVLGLIVYANTFQNAFVLDDFHVIEENPGIRELHPVSRHFVDATTMSSRAARRSYRPLLPLSLSLSHAVHGLDVWGYHLFNLVAHCVAATVFYLAFSRVVAIATEDRARLVATLAAAMFVVHPIAGMSVNYLSARDNLMMQTFLGVALWAYARLRADGDRWALWLTALVAYAAALLTKAPALAFPLVLVLFEAFVVRSGRRTLVAWARPLAFLFVAVLSVVVERIVPGVAPQLGPWSAARVATFAATQLEVQWAYYLRNFVYPFEMRGLPRWDDVASALDPGLLIGALLVAGSLLAAWDLRRRVPYVAFAIAAYWAMFLPTSSVFPLAQSLADRWMYPSLPYLCLVVAHALFAIVRAEALPWVLSALLAYFGGASIYMNTHWRTPLRFYEQSARYGTDATGHMNLGLEYLATDRVAARREFERALELSPYYHHAHVNLGLWHIRDGDVERGLDLVRRGVQYAPSLDRSAARYWLGVALTRAGRYADAVPELLHAYEAEPQQHEKLYEAAVAAHRAGLNAVADQLLGRLHAEVPNIELSRFLAGWLAWLRSDVNRAIAEYRIAARYRPDYAQIHFNLGYALKQRGQCREAIPVFETYLRLVPGNRAAGQHLAACKAG